MLVQTVGLRKYLMTGVLVCMLASFITGCKKNVFDINFTGTPLYGVEDLLVEFSGDVWAIDPYIFEHDEKFRGEIDIEHAIRIISWFWDFGDGSKGTGQFPSHVYVDPGLYTVSLTVTVLDVSTGKFYRCTLTREDYVEVIAANGPPVANAGVDEIARPEEEIGLNGTDSYDPDDDVLSYFWEVISAPGGLCVEGEGEGLPAEGEGEGEGISTGEGEGEGEGEGFLCKDENGDKCKDENKQQNPCDKGECEGEIIRECPGCSYTLTDETTFEPRFSAFCEGEYVIRLTVTTIDGSDSDEVSVFISNNDPPISIPGPDQAATSGPITLDGRESYDPDDYPVTPITYAWSIFSQPSCPGKGTSANIQNGTSAIATFNPDCDGEYVIQLTVNDGEFSDSDTTTITIGANANTPPVADAGTYETVCYLANGNKALFNAVVLDGTGSSDGDLDPLTYKWSIVSEPTGPGNPASFSDKYTASNPILSMNNPGTYTVALVVNDGTVNSQVSTATIVLGNCPPTADAGDDQSVPELVFVLLDGSGSSDPNLDPLTYAWNVISATLLYDIGQLYCAYALYTPTAESTFFAANCAGVYVIELTVDDGEFNDTDTVEVTVTEAVPVK